MKNPMQLKAAVNKFAKEKNILPQHAMQNYMLERLLERISVSQYKDYFVIKGGFLIASMAGLETRSTMDLDATLKGFHLNEQSIIEIAKNLCNINLDDNIEFRLKHIEQIREKDTYSGFRISFSALYYPMNVSVSIDITTGDKITPRECAYSYRLMFENREINILAYNLATLLAEKLETVISRGDLNTRPRDYYDIFILEKLRGSEINIVDLKAALAATSKHRNTEKILEKYNEIMDSVMQSKEMNKYWQEYSKKNAYAKGIIFSETCKTVIRIMDKIYTEH